MKKVRVAGLQELDRALGELPKATGKNVLRRVLLKRAQPIADNYRAGVDVQQGHLRQSIGASTKLTSRQASKARRLGKSTVEVYAGAGPDPAAHLEEFGSVHNAPNGALRRAWDGGRMAALEGLKDDLGAEVGKAAARLAKKRAKAGG
jgi:hypothetical protein